tara:strand:- start:46843 stop:47586 length:744 start_codon:yes stop_codon:yes gene_type:complete
MGILNLTPDSFYDGNPNINSNFLKDKLETFKYADIIDVGAESTRPFSDAISIDEEINRLSVFMEIKDTINKVLSIDSYKPEVIKYALNNGFNIINDISGGGDDNANIQLASEYNVPIIIMHMQGKPKTMQLEPKYDNVIDDIMVFFESKIDIMKNEFQLNDEQIIIDPGIGFGKTKEDNYLILDNVKKFKSLGFPVLIGLSRKSFLAVGDDKPEDRKSASLAAQSIAISNGADCIRTHDIEETYKTL